MGVEGTVIPTRFLTLVGHLTAIAMLYTTRGNNIKASLAQNYSSSDYSTADSSLLGGISAAFVCFAVNIMGLFGGFSMFLNGLNTLHIIAHFCGCVLTSWLILENWNYLAFWYIFVFFSLIPTLLELIVILRGLCLKSATF